MRDFKIFRVEGEVSKKDRKPFKRREALCSECEENWHRGAGWLVPETNVYRCKHLTNDQVRKRAQEL